MMARWVLIVLCVTACGGQNNGDAIDATPETFPVADAEDVAFDLAFDSALDVADIQPLPDTHDASPPPDVHDTSPPPDVHDTIDTVDTTPLPDTFDAADPDLPCVPDCEGKECGDNGCGGSCGVCINPCDPCGVKGGPWEDPDLCVEPEGVCVTACCPLCCDDLECVDDGCGGTCGVCDPPELSSFSFLASENPSLTDDIHLDIVDNSITGSMPYSGDIANLVASFSFVGSAVLVDNLNQTSGTSINDFSHTVTYSVSSLDGQLASYDVRVKYFTGLPIVYIDTYGVAITSKYLYTVGTASIFGGLNYADHPFADMIIRGRGHSTWGIHPKKPYQLNFDEKTKVLGMPEDKKWIFLAEYSDKTLMRTTIGFTMGYLSDLEWTPESNFAEVFINDQYNGTYNITQKVENSKNRVDLGDTGYLLEIENINHIADGDVYFYTDSFLIKIKEPDLLENSAEYLYISDFMNEFESVLMGDDFTDPAIGYPSYIDIDSFIDWYLINEITKNVDARSYSSIYLSVIPGEKIKMGPLWDFDLSFGNVNYADPEHPEGFWIKEGPWYNRLFQDPVFVDQVKSRFLFFMDNMDYILDTMDYYADYLSLAQQENDAKWHSIGVYVWPNPVVFDTYEEEVAHLKSWYIERMEWLDTAFFNL